ncbi:LysR family transcriptional regulator [Oricola sp.]|uniref:LysR family transcriptional regulator n=1 Tax=Oricola sp. TaxID=1979950 RepID=UPI003BA90956
MPLLATFQAMLDHGGVTEAAEALGLTQSAVSKHLAKLRAAYGDPLFIRTPEGMRPTPRATWMSAHVATILAEAEALSEARLFQPRLLDGILSISTTDEVCESLLAHLVPALEEQAPGLRLTFVPLNPDYSFQDLEAGRVDLVVSVNWHAPEGLKQSRLFDDRFVCLMGAGHALAECAFTIQEFAEHEHVMVAPLGMREGRIDEVLAAHDLRRVIRLSVPVFLQVNPTLLGDRYLATLPARVAEELCRRHPGTMIIRSLPFDISEISYYALWHTRFDRDPRHIWLRNLVRKSLNTPSRPT